MRRMRVICLAFAIGGLGACSAADDGWRPSVHSASDTAALHLTCVGGGLAEVTMGTLSGGLDGAGKGVAVAANMIGGQVDNQAAWAFVGGGAAIGGTIGIGAGLGGEVLKWPAGYDTCLRNKRSLFSSSKPET